MVFARVGVNINYPTGDTGQTFRTQLHCVQSANLAWVWLALSNSIWVRSKISHLSCLNGKYPTYISQWAIPWRLYTSSILWQCYQNADKNASHCDCDHIIFQRFSTWLNSSSMKDIEGDPKGLCKSWGNIYLLCSTILCQHFCSLSAGRAQKI